MATIFQIPSQAWTGQNVSPAFAIPNLPSPTPVTVKVTSSTWATDDPGIILEVQFQVRQNGVFGDVFGFFESPQSKFPNGNPSPPPGAQLPNVVPYSGDQCRVLLSVTKIGQPATLTFGATITIG